MMSTPLTALPALALAPTATWGPQEEAESPEATPSRSKWGTLCLARGVCWKEAQLPHAGNIFPPIESGALGTPTVSLGASDLVPSR